MRPGSVGGEKVQSYQNTRVLVTGHTGFKGSWLCKMLLLRGATVTGYALSPDTAPSLFSLSGLSKHMDSRIGDVRDSERLEAVYKEAKPDIVFHLAAQPIVRVGYENPAYTYETNVMGVVHLLECIRNNPCASFVNVTTDKVYRPESWPWGYRETDRLDGYDAYASSKTCAELVTRCYRDCFLAEKGVAASTVRAGNVIGGGDFARDRIMPDCVRSALQGEVIGVRNPHAIRPYQHVLEPLYAYLSLAQQQREDPSLSDGYNIGPAFSDCITTGELADLFCTYFGASWQCRQDAQGPKEAAVLRLDCAKALQKLGFHPIWSIERAVAETVSFAKAYQRGENLNRVMEEQILMYCKEQEVRSKGYA